MDVLLAVCEFTLIVVFEYHGLLYDSLKLRGRLPQDGRGWAYLILYQNGTISLVNDDAIIIHPKSELDLTQFVATYIYHGYRSQKKFQGAPAAAVPNTSGFGNLDLSSLLNTAGPRPPVANLPQPVARAAVPQAVAPPSAPLSLEDLQRAMFGTPTPNTAGAASSTQNQAQAQNQGQGQRVRQQAPETPAFQDIILSEDVIASGILSDPHVVSALISQLPEGQQSVEHLEGTIRSAQLQQALGSLTNAVVHPDNYASVMSNFQINGEAGMQQLIRGDGVGAFLTSIQSQNPPVATGAAAESTPVASAAPSSGSEGKENEENTKMEE